MGFSAKAVSKDTCLCQAPPVLHATASLLDSTRTGDVVPGFVRVP
jgi:hypothetical protein